MKSTLAIPLQSRSRYTATARVLNVRGQVRIDVSRGLLSTLARILRFIIEESVVADDFRDRQKTRLATRLRRNHATREFTTIEKRLHHHGITRCKGRLEGRLELTRLVYPRHSDARTALTGFDETGQSIASANPSCSASNRRKMSLRKIPALATGCPSLASSAVVQALWWPMAKVRGWEAV